MLILMLNGASSGSAPATPSRLLAMWGLGNCLAALALGTAAILAAL